MIPDHEHQGPAPDAEDQLRAIVNALPAMIGYWDRDLRNRMANDVYVDFFGRTPAQVHGRHIRDLLGPELFAQNHPYMERALAGEPQLFDRAIPGPDGRVRHTQASYIPDFRDGEVHGFVVLVTDITERRLAERGLELAERRFRTLFAAAPVATFLVGEDGLIIDANHAAEELFGRPADDLTGRSPLDFTHPDDVAESRRYLVGLLAGAPDGYRLEKRYLHRDGHVVWGQLDVRPLPAEPGVPPQVLAQVQDVTDRRRQQEELERMATYDALTGLLNRRGMFATLELECRRVHRYGGDVALLVVDLDGFKQVNDTAGHQAGDEVLAAVAGLLRSRLRQSDVAARHGGDEFAVVLLHTTEAEARKVADEVEAMIRAARLGAPGDPVTASIGVTVFGSDEAAADVLARADQAMYAAKRAGGGAVVAG